MRTHSLLRRLSLVPVLALLGACVSVEATRLGEPARYPAVAQDEVRVYRSESEIPQPFERVAVLWLEGDSELTSRRQMVDAARKKAGRMGANAIVLGEFKEPSTLERVAGAILDVQTEWETQVLAVRIHHEPAAAAADSAEAARR
jgi:hypothetical protein